MKSRRCAKATIELVQTGPSLILKFKEMAALPQIFCSCVAILWNFKTRLCPIWTNSRLGVAHPLLFLQPPSILSTWLCRKCILSFGGDCKLFKVRKLARILHVVYGMVRNVTFLCLLIFTSRYCGEWWSSFQEVLTIWSNVF